MAVMTLNHSNAGAHLYRQRVYVHAIVEKCKRSIGVNRPQFAGGSKVSMDGAYGKKQQS